MALVFPSSHPLVQHKLVALRATQTGPAEFRQLVRSLACLLAQEATADLPTGPVEVTTPLGTAAGRVLSDTVGIVPILRAGLGMAEGVLELFPEAEVWHIGLYRDEHTLKPMEYYKKLPPRPRISIALVVDPMLATGGSAVHACKILKGAGVCADQGHQPDRGPRGDRADGRGHAGRADLCGCDRRPPERGRLHRARTRRRRRPPVPHRRCPERKKAAEPQRESTDASRGHHPQEARRTGARRARDRLDGRGNWQR